MKNEWRYDDIFNKRRKWKHPPSWIRRFENQYIILFFNWHFIYRGY